MRDIEAIKRDREAKIVLDNVDNTPQLKEMWKTLIIIPF